MKKWIIVSICIGVIFYFYKREVIGGGTSAELIETSDEQSLSEKNLKERKPSSEVIQPPAFLQERHNESSSSKNFRGQRTQSPVGTSQDSNAVGTENYSDEISHEAHGIDRVQYTVESFAKQFPNDPLLKEAKEHNYDMHTIYDTKSQFGEIKIPITSLKVSCPLLKTYEEPLTFRVSDDGRVLGIVSILPGAPPIPDELYQCRFEGGSEKTFLVDFIPG